MTEQPQSGVPVVLEQRFTISHAGCVEHRGVKVPSPFLPAVAIRGSSCLWRANLGATGTEFLLRVPEIVWGPFHIKNVLFVSRPDETFSDTSFETPSSITGALGGNVLKAFRVEIDYPHGITYLQ
jgi:hypothetical protein